MEKQLYKINESRVRYKIKDVNIVISWVIAMTVYLEL